MSLKNLVKVTVANPYGASATSIVVDAGTGANFPAVPFEATYWNVTDYPDPADDPFAEIVNVTARSVDTLTVTRAYGDTVATAKNLNGKRYVLAVTVTTGLVDGKLDKPK